MLDGLLLRVVPQATRTSVKSAPHKISVTLNGCAMSLGLMLQESSRRRETLSRLPFRNRLSNDPQSTA